MFDDQINQNNQGGVPKNLPTGEPEDMFANISDSAADESVEKGDEAVVSVPSALGAGVLTPKKPETSEPKKGGIFPAEQPAPPTASPIIPPEGYAVKEPALTRGLVMMVLILIGIGIIAGGGWWFYNSFIKTSNQAVVEETAQPESAVVEETAGVTEPVAPEENVDIGKEVTDEQVLFGEPIDKDGDGLDDSRETEIGTDPNNWDTDNDQLSDGDEVIIWKTDPKNPDSDGDGYLDGLEVKNGYSPSGPGKIFEPPSTNQ